MTLARLGCLLAACSGGTPTTTGSTTPTEDEILADFSAWLADHADCTVAEDCVVISPGCPLGCYAAVAEEHAAEARALADELIEACGCICDYSCTPGGPADCVDGQCVLLPYD
jgi:hypothetical protein